jgi:Kef-type K+ transport system membrane component KefB
MTLLLGTARLLGGLAQRLGQPSVVGEILAGVLLGPSLLSGLLPGLAAWLVPQTALQTSLLDVVALLGALLFLLIIGMEIDLALIRHQLRATLATGVGDVLLPLSVGLMLGLFIIPADLLVNPEQRLVFALFFATAISISAIAVVAKVLLDLNLMRRSLGQFILAVSMLDDTVTWIMLSIVAALASGAALTVGTVAGALGTVLLFLVFSFTVGRWLVQRVLRVVQAHARHPDAMLSAIVGLALLWATLAQALHLEAVLGAFVLGIVLGQFPAFSTRVLRQLHSLTLSIFAPIFFAVAGLKVNIWTLLEPRLLGLTLLLIGAACLAKTSGVYLGARYLARLPHSMALSSSLALNARGATLIVMANVGLALNLLTPPIFSILVVMAIITSLLAPITLRWSLHEVAPDDEEQARLQRETHLKDNPFATAHRVLVPVRLREESPAEDAKGIEALLLERLAGPRRLDVTLLSVVAPAARAQAQTFLGQVAPLFGPQQISKKVLTGCNPEQAILDEAAASYDLLVMGASDRARETEALFSPLIDYLVRYAPCPTMVVHGPALADDWAPRRILVPTNGSLASRRAAQLAYTLAADGLPCVVIIHGLVPDSRGYALDMERQMQHQQQIAQQMVDDLSAMGTTMGVHVGTHVRHAPDPETAILELARESEIDLIVLGTNVRAGTERLYLGQRVEYILRHAPCPVLVVNTPR